MIILACALLPLLGISFTLRPWRVRGPLVSLLGVAGFAFLFSVLALAGSSKSESFRLLGGWFVSDATSRLFVALISAVFLGISLYVYNRVLTNPFAVRNIQSFVRGALLFFAVSVLAVLSDHFILMWIFLECTTLAAAPLVDHQKGPASTRASWKYFLFSVVALSLVFLGFVLLSWNIPGVPQSSGLSFFFQETGSLAARAGPFRELGFVLIVLGFGTKMGLAPMYTWLPEAYDLSPPSVTALLSAVQFNVVILALFRVVQYFHLLEFPVVRYELMFFGLVSVLVSALHIVVAKNYKRLIAYASINHAGVIAIGLGVGKSAAYGVILYVISNALVKALLFLTCGNIKARYRTKSMLELHGLIREMPFSGWFFMIGIFALLGFAPFGSFFGEVLIMKGMIDGRHFAIFALFCLLTTVVFVATGRATFPMIWGEPLHEPSLRGESVYMLLPSLFFVFLLLSLGIYLPTEANAFLQSIAAGLGG